MGLDISKINAQYTKLVDLAYENDSDNTEHLNILIGEEFTKFRAAAREWANTTNTDEARAAVRETLGLYVTDPAEKPADTTPAETKTEETVAPAAETKTEPTKKEIKQAKKEDKNAREHVTKFVKGYLEGNSSVIVANLVETLRKDIEGEKFKKIIDAIEKAIKDLKFSSKDDVEKIKKTLKDRGLSDDLAESIMKIAKREQVEKEKKQLREKYDAIVAAEEQGTIVNYTKRLEKLEEKMNDLNWTGNSYYSKEALDELKNDIKKEIHDVVHAKMLKLEVKDFGNDDNTKEKEIREKLKAEFPNDTFAHEVINKMKDFAGVTARGINTARTREQLKSISYKDLKKELSADTLNFLETNWLKDVRNTETGNYDLTAISDTIAEAIGADNEMNYYEDLKASEVQKAIDNLNTLLQLRGENVIDESNLKDLMDLCNIKKAKKDRSAKTAFRNALNEGIAGTAIGGVLAAINIKSISESTAGIIAGAGAKASVQLWPAGAAVAAAEIPLDALLNFIFGVDKGERTCFNYQDANGKTIDEYINHLETTENEDKAKAIAVLAKLYHAKHGNNWNTEFVKDMKELAGNNTLNCLEFFYGKLELEQKLTATEAVGEQQDPKPPVAKEETERITTTENVTHYWKAGQSWQAMVLAFYPDAFEGKTYDEIRKMIKPFVNEFRRSQNIGFRQGLPVKQTVEFKPITVNGVTYQPVQATPEDIKKCTSNEWFGYGSNYFTGNWNIPTEGNAKVNGQKRYTSTRESDGATNSGNDQTETQNALIPGAQENVRTTVTITNVDGTTRTRVIDPLEEEK